MVMGSFFVQAQDVTLTAFLASLPIAFIVTAILHCNNLRDVGEDRVAGKRSVAMLIGPRASLWAYAALMYGAYAVILAVTVAQVLPWFALLGLAPLPLAHKAVRLLFAAVERPQFNRVMVLSAKVHGWTGVALAGGLTVAAIV
jgi:1,4-dihydroxy-2-naphthoate octaprenyltransferase